MTGKGRGRDRNNVRNRTAAGCRSHNDCASRACRPAGNPRARNHMRRDVPDCPSYWTGYVPDVMPSMVRDPPAMDDAVPRNGRKDDQDSFSILQSSRNMNVAPPSAPVTVIVSNA